MTRDRMAWARGLAFRFPEKPAAPAVDAPQTAPAAAPAADIPDQIRKLMELRDAGALPNEEFEARKRDLLDPM